MKNSERVELQFVISLYNPRDLFTLLRELERFKLGIDLPITLHCASEAFPPAWDSGARTLFASQDKPADEERKLLDFVKRALAEGSLSFLPAGYVSGVHQHLNNEEINADREWALYNPWKQGFADIFAAEPEMYLPFWPDPFRSLDTEKNSFTLNLQSSCNLDTWGTVYWGKNRAQELRFVPVYFAQEFLSDPKTAQANPSADLPLLSKLGSKLQQRCKNLSQLSAQYNEVLSLMVQIPWMPELCNLEKLQKTLLRLKNKNFPLVNTARVLDPQKFSLQNLEQRLPVQAIQPLLNPSSRFRLLKMAETRMSRSTVSERLRSRLQMTRPEGLLLQKSGKQEFLCLLKTEEDSLNDFHSTRPKSSGRGMVSHMQGAASMMAETFHLDFEEGSPKTFSFKDDQIRFQSKINDAAGLAKKSFILEQGGAVGFETDRLRGLRQNLSLNLHQASLPGRLSTDYILSDRSLSLIVDINLRFPWIKENLVFSHLSLQAFDLEIPAYEGFEGVLINWVNPQGERSSCTLNPAKNKDIYELLCSGTAWTFHWTSPQGKKLGLLIQRMPSEARLPAPFMLRYVPRKKSLHLQMYPEGRYHHVSSMEVQGLHMHYTLAVCPIFDTEPAQVDPLAERDFEPFYMFKEDLLSSSLH